MTPKVDRTASNAPVSKGRSSASATRISRASPSASARRCAPSGHYERALELWDRVTDPGAVAGVGRPALLEAAADVASGAGEHECAIRYVDAAIGELEHATMAPEAVGALYERKAWYLGCAGRWDESPEWTGRAVALVPPEPLTPTRARVLARHALALTM
jgi:hypothetical protein